MVALKESFLDCCAKLSKPRFTSKVDMACSFPVIHRGCR